MKTIKLMLTTAFAVILSIHISSAQNYKNQFHIDEKGVVTIKEGSAAGTIENDGTIKNAKGEVVGKISAHDKGYHLADKLGKKMAEAMADGSLKDSKGKILYSISKADEKGICQILNASGKTVGTVHENYKKQGACAYHCLANHKK